MGEVVSLRGASGFGIGGNAETHVVPGLPSCGCPIRTANDAQRVMDGVEQVIRQHTGGSVPGLEDKVRDYLCIALGVVRGAA